MMVLFQKECYRTLKLFVGDCMWGVCFLISCNYSFAGKTSEKRAAFEKNVGGLF